MSRFAKGSRPSPDDPRDWPLHKLTAARVAIPDVVNHENLIEVIQDQGQYGSCVGWGSTRAWHLRARIQGDLTVHYPSATAVYSEAVASDVGDPTVPLRDEGTFPRSGLTAMAKLGVVPLSAFNPDVIPVRPNWATFTQSADRRGVQFARVYGATEMRTALAAGFPIVVGFDVDQSFEDYAGGVWNGMQSAALGGHCTCWFGYKPGAFRGVNSWSASWGESGMYWISDAAADGVEAWAVQLVSA
jgi:hypothetical protein